MKRSESDDEKLKRLFDELGEEFLPANNNPWEKLQNKIQTQTYQKGTSFMQDINSSSSTLPEKTRPKTAFWRGALAGTTGLMLILVIVAVIAALGTNKPELPGANSGFKPAAQASATPAPTHTSTPQTNATATPTPAQLTPATTPNQSTTVGTTATPTPNSSGAGATPTPTPAQLTPTTGVAGSGTVGATSTPAPNSSGAGATATPTAAQLTPTTAGATSQEQFRQQALTLLGNGWKIKEADIIENNRFYVLAYKPADPKFIQQFSSNQFVSASEAVIVQQDTQGKPFIALSISVKERILRSSKTCLSKLPKDADLPNGTTLAGLAIPSGYTPPAGTKVQLNVVWVDPEGTPLNQGIGAWWDSAQQDYRLYIADYIRELRPEYCK